MVGSLLLLALSCDPMGERRVTTPEERQETYRIVKETCESVHAAPYVCKMVSVVTWRESRGVATRTHTRGKNEIGFGPHGISWKFHRGLIENATRDDFCDPRQSTLAVLELWQRFYQRGAKTPVELQRGYSGRNFRDDSRPKSDRWWCSLLRHAGVRCKRKLERQDLGDSITAQTVRELAKRIH